jgi:hypothetical protein
MRETGIGTSLILIATGAVLAFAVHLRSAAIDISAIGAILMVIGIIGLLLTFIMLSESFPWGRRYYSDDVTAPHEHRQVETKDIVYEDDGHDRVERVRRYPS